MKDKVFGRVKVTVGADDFTYTFFNRGAQQEFVRALKERPDVAVRDDFFGLTLYGSAASALQTLDMVRR